MLQQSLELPQELEQLVCFQDDFALADTSIDPLFHPPQKQPTFISQPHLPTYQDDNPSLVQDFQQQSYSKRRKSFHYSNSNQDDTQINYNETMLASQSIAARQRRRKIADKTQELGKLIPGGHKMNTSEMFQSASIPYMSSFCKPRLEGIKCYGDEEQHLKVLAASPVVQEKLYAQEKCLAPQKLLQSLSNDSKLQSEHPSVFQQINT
ncbi:hypothetical protein QQ045_015522 [Rhodiola kirilowii]